MLALGYSKKHKTRSTIMLFVQKIQMYMLICIIYVCDKKRNIEFDNANNIRLATKLTKFQKKVAPLRTPKPRPILKNQPAAAVQQYRIHITRSRYTAVGFTTIPVGATSRFFPVGATIMCQNTSRYGTRRLYW